MSGVIPNVFDVDNAAQIFVAINSKKETTMSRISVFLDSEIDKSLLQQALKEIIKRFPYFQVYLKKRFFNFVFERTNDIPPIKEDNLWTNRYVDFTKNNFPFNIKVKKHILSIELSHIISDGFGTLVFLLTLTAKYLELKGIKVEEHPLIKQSDEDIDPDEWECAFRKNFPLKGPSIKLQPPAYIPSGTMIPVSKYYSTKFIMNLGEVRTLAGYSNVTLNVYVSAIYTCAIQELFFQDKKNGVIKGNMPIRIQIPVNLRKYYPTKTMRNFSYLYSPVFYVSEEPKNFEEIVRIIADDIRHERHSRSVEHQISRNLRAENNIFFRYLPRFLKQLLFKIFYHVFARSVFSGVITNLGDIQIPEAMEEHILDFEILPCNSPVPGRNTALYSYKGKLEMNIGSSVDDLRLENEISSILTKLGIHHEVIYKRDKKEITKQGTDKSSALKIGFPFMIFF